MSFFDRVYEKLFPGNAPSGKAILHERIARSETYLKRYQAWKASGRLTALREEVARSYYLKQQAIDSKPEVHLLQSNYANGFAISYSSEINKEDFGYFFDWLAERVEGLGYKRSNSDILVTDKKTYVESREKHYLKPVAGPEKPTDQKFGNILIESISIDENPGYIKLTANIYNDHSYKTALEFSTLAEYLFEIT